MKLLSESCSRQAALKVDLKSVIILTLNRCNTFRFAIEREKVWKQNFLI